jgi:glycosyltransferase involved in cell wall biosynthesis
MDCYPEVVERAGLLRTTSVGSRLMRSLNRWLFGELDHLICLDPAMDRLLSAQYITASNRVATSVIENWEALADFPPAHDPPRWTEADRLELSDKFVVLYRGNAGYGHEFGTVFEAAARLESEGFVFVFVGGGARWDRIREARDAQGLSNLHMFGYAPRELTASVIAAAHCGLVTLSDAFLGVISPSKIHASLAMGLPLVYLGPTGGNVDLAIRRYECGVSLRHGDVDGLVTFLRRLKEDPAERLAYQRRARRAFEEAYSDAVALPKFDRILDQLVTRPPG